MVKRKKEKRKERVLWTFTFSIYFKQPTGATPLEKAGARAVFGGAGALPYKVNRGSQCWVLSHKLVGPNIFSNQVIKVSMCESHNKIVE